MSKPRLTIRQLMLVVGVFAILLLCLRIMSAAQVYAFAPAVTIGAVGCVLTDGKGCWGRFFTGATIAGLLAALIVFSPLGEGYRSYVTSVFRFVQRHAPDVGTPSYNVPVSSIPGASLDPSAKVFQSTTLYQPGPIASSLMLAGLLLPSLGIALIGGLAALWVRPRSPHFPEPINTIS